MKSTPLILDSPADLGKQLVRIESQPGDTKTEKWLQDLLYRHPELLPVDDFDETFAPPIPIGREVATARGPIDNLYVSPTGGISVVETKLWKSPDKHRTVVAQIIDYAKELATWNYDRLCEAVLASSRKRGEEHQVSLEEKVKPGLEQQGIPLHEFQGDVAASLSEGSFLLLIIGDRISPNIALLTRAIQGAPGLNFTIGLVEMQFYQAQADKDWPLIVVPDVVGRTVEKTRGVVRVRYMQEKPEVAVEVENDNESATQAGQLDLETFLTQIHKDLVVPFREGIVEWEKIGGKLKFATKVMFFMAELEGQPRKMVRCWPNKLSLLRRKWLEEWSYDPNDFELYLEDLQDAPAAAEHARNDKMWLNYEKINPHELRVILRAARELVQRIHSGTG